MVDKIRSRDVESGCLKDIDTEQSLRGYSIHVVQQSFGSTIGSPVSFSKPICNRQLICAFFQTALAIGAFATTLTTLSCALMGFRGLSNTDVFVANFNFW